MKTRLLALAVLAGACSEPTPPPTPVVSLQLTADQAAAVNNELKTITASTPEIAGLGDSVSLIVKTGAVVDSADIDVSFGGGTYYAVALQRAVSQTVNPFSTFDIVYFNNPSNPTRFVIVSVWARGQAGPPDGALANLATPTSVLIANVHFYQVDGQNVTHWKSTAGDLVLGNGLSGGACADVNTPNNVTCERADLLIGSHVTASTRVSGSASGTPTMTIQSGLVRGIRLRYQILDAATALSAATN
jgi:hypothetical protein